MTTPNNEIDLMSWQVGAQSAFATGVAPTKKLMGISDGELAPAIETSEVEEQRGSLAPAYNVTLDKVTGAAKLSGDATYEHLAIFLDSLLGIATPGTTPTFKRDYAAPLTAKPTPRILTLVHGSTEGVYGLVGGIVNEFTLKGESNKRVTFDAGLLGRSVEADTLETLTDSAVNFVHANQMSMYVDLWAGTLGATALTATAFSFELGMNASRALKPGLGSVYPKDVSQKKAAVGSNSLKLALEYEAGQSKAWFDAMISSSAVFKAQVRLKWNISTTQDLQVDFCGWQKETPTAFPDADGIAQLELNLAPLYHDTVANWLKISLTNSTADCLA